MRNGARWYGSDYAQSGHSITGLQATAKINNVI